MMDHLTQDEINERIVQAHAHVQTALGYIRTAYTERGKAWDATGDGRRSKNPRKIARRMITDLDSPLPQAQVELLTADKLYWEVASSFEGFVRHRYGKWGDDGVSRARVGLYEAAIRFEPERGLRFLVLARWWTRARFQDLDGKGWLSGGPRQSRRTFHFKQPDVWLDTPFGNRGELRWVDQLEADTPDPVLRLDCQRAAHAVTTLKCPRHAAIINYRFGLDGGEPLSLLKIGERLGGLSRERIRQLEAEALSELRELMTSPACSRPTL